ncbi:hypothetical protein HK098_006551 [Nowakowskiella sp. JEL0407]|nr:hypothetical protein HK098_006551 [Nowakowskiella sp. JEL0407]
MTANLPATLLKLFAPRPQIKYAPPLDRDFSKRTHVQLSGVAQFLDQCKDHDKDYVPQETLEQARKRKADEKKKKSDEAIIEGLSKWNPHSDPHAVGDPYNTLFVARLVHIVRNPSTNQSRGYGFVEFERERDMKAAYKDADGIKLMGRRILVDVERGRTVKDWKPRKFGGGLGGTRIGDADKNHRYSGRDVGYVKEDRDEHRGSGGGGGGYGGGRSGGGGGYRSGGYGRDSGRSGHGGGRYDDRRGGGYDRGNDRRDYGRHRSRSPRGYDRDR